MWEVLDLGRRRVLRSRKREGSAGISVPPEIMKIRKEIEKFKEQETKEEAHFKKVFRENTPRILKILSLPDFLEGTYFKWLQFFGAKEIASCDNEISKGNYYALIQRKGKVYLFWVKGNRVGIRELSESEIKRLAR